MVILAENAKARMISVNKEGIISINAAVSLDLEMITV